MLLRIGSRGSRLALTQAEQAAALLRRPGVEIAFVPITTAGDRDRKQPFGQIGARGVFVKEIEEALLAGRIDVAVHSAKDMTSSDTDGLVVGAYLRARRPARCADRRRGDSCPACASAPPRPAGGRSCSRSSRRCRSSRCEETSTRACASCASAGWTRSCSRPAGSTGSGSAGRDRCAARSERDAAGGGPGRARAAGARGRGGARRGGGPRRDATPRRAGAPLCRDDRSRVPGTGRRASRRVGRCRR